MSKTVLLPDELHKRIQDYKIELNGVEIKMSIAKKLELFYDNYVLDNTHETFEEFRYNNRHVLNDIIDDKIKADKTWMNP